MSRALNYSGDPVPRNHPGQNTIKGGDGLRYAYRVREFRKHMNHRYGPPSLISGGGTVEPDFHTTKGIIMFDVAGWESAAGPFDVWGGSEWRSGEYSAEAMEVCLWQTW